MGLGNEVFGAGTTVGPRPGGAVIGANAGGEPGAIGPPPETPGPVGIGLQTPPNDPAAEAGGLAGQK